ncbi:ABC transporter substrate-binding protein [Intrasporangium oryzae NRRL B-24470]|uniref:ABC transporter substrate-binding protein n=1 Tax=Intrasporangium oryzae NRRL B-24470 TaxID=1386089 RepID=W9G7X1_9MICO|nr:transporter substrate-binding domain-containing protein [Intrasporangium oryzae]EWT02120.1 ABC transporter substrate-binding protein [Intrasporangium oryzae NRRL B-24470]
MKSRTTLRSIAVVAGLSALALAGCSSGPATGGSTPAASAPGGSGVSLISPGKLTVCTHLPYAPFQSNDDSGKTVGFDVDMMDLVAKKLGVEQAIVDTPFEGIKSGQDMATGKCDIAAAGMTITDARKKAILFSVPYFDATQALLVPNGSTVKSLADLKGKKLGAQSSTTGLDYATKNKAANGYEIVEFQDLASETQALLTGQVDAAINDLPVWSEALKQNPGKAMIATQFNTGEQYGFGMKLGNEALAKVVDDVITTSKTDGTYDQLFKKWIGEVPAS